MCALVALLSGCSSSEGGGGGPGDGADDESDAGDGDADDSDDEDDEQAVEDAGSDAALGPCDAGQTENCVITEPEPTCGDGLINVPGEQCDDRNLDSDDGCTATCMRDPDYACPVPGEPCVYTVECGDEKVGGDETCDDGDTAAGDGCDASCKLEPGWTCPVIGLRCQAASCGDGIVAGFEECDFLASSAGCSDCRIEPGYDCDATGCAVTVCGDGVVERGEQCDPAVEAVDTPFDGCFACKKEPACSDGVCTPVCGDGQRFADEPCDDGNVQNGDGCSDACAVEDAFACTDLSADPPAQVHLPVIYRDFIGKDRNTAATAGCEDPVAVPATTNPCYHIDFNRLSGSIRLGVLESELDASGRPVYVCPDPQTSCAQNPGHVANGGRFTFNGPEAFSAWYDSSSPQARQVIGEVGLDRDTASGQYVFDSAPAGGFYPLDNLGWVLDGKESSTSDCNGNAGRNVSFTSETHFWFEYQGSESFAFNGDDDLWVFVNGKLLLDLGGLHGPRSASFTLGASGDPLEGSATVTNTEASANPFDVALGLTLGGVYEVSMFHAERNECGSNFKVTLKDFNRPKSECKSTCGDGELASDELCDEGDANADPPPYEGCSEDCKTRGHYCGDGVHDGADGEACDDGSNVTVYGEGTACAPGCKLPAFCGDGVVQSAFGEKCDDATNGGAYGECAPGCVLGPRCGDRAVQAEGGEECDDGNLENYDGCNVNCKDEIIL
jgi:fibro-slime domain-containing protein